jgi:hypothetical protein
MDAAAEGEVLIIVVDAAAQSWAQSDTPLDGGSDPSTASLRFPDFVAILTTFLCTHAVLGRNYHEVVLAHNGEIGGYVVLGDINTGSDNPSPRSLHKISPAAIARQLPALLYQLRYGPADQLDGYHISTRPGVFTPFGPKLNSLSRCLSAGLCFLGQTRRHHPRLRGRMLVLQAGADEAEQYMAVINCAFSAARHGALLDSALLIPARQSVCLQQAAHITRGVHMNVAAEERGRHPAALLQLLTTVYLPEANLRTSRLLPLPQPGVDLRASCFCHHKHKSEAWICTVCLSVFCEHSPVCATCGAGSEFLPPSATGTTAREGARAGTSNSSASTGNSTETTAAPG